MTQLREILTGNPTVIRMVVSFYRNARGQNALRQILAEPVREVLQDRSLSIRTSPVEIYRGWINETESQSGQQRWAPIAGISPLLGSVQSGWGCESRRRISRLETRRACGTHVDRRVAGATGPLPPHTHTNAQKL